MSTYYYLVCDTHKVCSRVIGGRSFPQRWWSNDEGELEDFLREHGDCDPCPQLINEWDDRHFEYAELPPPEGVAEAEANWLNLKGYNSRVLRDPRWVVPPDAS